jgi:RNA polymerase sigma-70 factor (ECF subfamily)
MEDHVVPLDQASSRDAIAVRMDVLVRRWCDGDRAVFDTIILETELDLRAFALSRTWAIGDAEEAVQSAYVVAFERMAEYRGPGSFISWLKGIVRNRLLELGRDRMRQRHDVLDEAINQVWDEAMTEVDEAGVRGRLQALQSCMEHLDQRSRELLKLHHLEGIQLNQLAQRFRRPRQAMARLLFTIRNNLRDCVGHRLSDGACHD